MSTVRHYVDLNENDLIAAVEQHQILYDRTLKGYKKPVERENAWQLVEEQINFPAAECKKRWRSLRDAFMKQHRWLLKGNKSVKRKTWLFFNQMQFLTPYINITQTEQSNIHCDVYDEMSNAELKETKIEMEDIKFMPNEEGIEEEEEEEAESEEHLYETNDLIHFPLNDKSGQDNADVVSSDNLLGDTSIDPLSAGPSALMQTKEMSSKEHELKVHSVSSAAHFDLLDSNDQFLLSCSPILKRLPKRKNSLVRMKIQKLLYDIEFDSENISD